MPKRPAKPKQQPKRRPRLIACPPEYVETAEKLIDAAAGPLDNMPDGDEDDEDEGHEQEDGAP